MSYVDLHPLVCVIPVLGATHLAQEALAGLASTEDFSNVTLRKTDTSSRSALNEHLPYNDVMLLHVKGKYGRSRKGQSPCYYVCIRLDSKDIFSSHAFISDARFDQLCMIRSCFVYTLCLKKNAQFFMFGITRQK